MPNIPKSQLPQFVRRAWDRHKKATKDLRDAEKMRLEFYVGGDFQWREEERSKRKNQQRPWITINRCKPAVDQIEGDVRMNPPGPQVLLVGGADDDTGDIIEGLIRETEYRSGVDKGAYPIAGRYCAASGYGVIELKTEYVNDRSFDQRLRIDPVEDPSVWFFDPDARMPNRQDAMWAGKLCRYSKESYIAKYGSNRRLFKPKQQWRIMGWIQDAFDKYTDDGRSLLEWTGEKNDGPYYVCEFYMVETEPATLSLYSDNIARFDDEEIPKGVTKKPGSDSRDVPRRKIKLYVVDALETLDETEWFGNLIPGFPVLGPEVYIDGKLYRLSLIAGALDAQRGLNYAATTAAELAGLMPKSPWIGPEGTFQSPNWQTANTEMWAYLEYHPVFITDEVSGARQLAPPPQRNQWETPIQWLLALGAYFADAIKAVTSIYDPSLGVQAHADQSGSAIAQLRSESSAGTFSYSDTLHRAIEIMYQEMCIIFPKIYDGPQAVTIVRPDSQHEVMDINQIFDRERGEHLDAQGNPKPTNTLGFNQYAVRVIAGPNFETRQRQAVDGILNFLKIDPQVIAVPGVAARLLRMLGEGNPEVEGIADLLAPDPTNQNPEQLAQQVTAAKQQNQVLTMLLQKMQQAMAAKLPEIEARKWEAALKSLTQIRVAEVNASKDMDNANADRIAAQLEQMMGNAHDAATQAVDHQHDQSMQQQDQMHQQQMPAITAASQPEPEPTGATQ